MSGEEEDRLSEEGEEDDDIFDVNARLGRMTVSNAANYRGASFVVFDQAVSDDEEGDILSDVMSVRQSLGLEHDSQAREDDEESRNFQLMQTVLEQEKRIALLEEKLDQVLSIVNSRVMSKVLASYESAPVMEVSTTEKVSRKLRGFVSLNKVRFQQDGFDLDLTYITPQVLAMGYPTEGVEAVYRNPMSEAVRFFNHYHQERYKIYNLCTEPNRQYDNAAFNGNVEIYPFKDHNPCPLNLIRVFCEDCMEWLGHSQAHVAAIHCKAGKGRTGMMISALLVYNNPLMTASEALATFGTKRTYDGKGVTIPSQKRFVQYFAQLRDQKDYFLPTHRFTLSGVSVLTVPNYSVMSGGCMPFFLIYEANPYETLVFDSRQDIPVTHVKKKQGGFQFKQLENLGIRVAGNVRIEFHHQTNSSSASNTALMFSFWFHTAFIPPSNTLLLSKSELDGPHKDNFRYEKNFQVQFEFIKEECVDKDLTYPYALTKQSGIRTREMLLRRLSCITEREIGHANDRRCSKREELDEDEEELVESRAPQTRVMSYTASKRDVTKPTVESNDRSVSDRLARGRKVLESWMFFDPESLKPAGMASVRMTASSKRISLGGLWGAGKGPQDSLKKLWFRFHRVPIEEQAQGSGSGGDTLIVSCLPHPRSDSEPMHTFVKDPLQLASVATPLAEGMEAPPSRWPEVIVPIVQKVRNAPRSITLYLKGASLADALQWVDALNKDILDIRDSIEPEDMAVTSGIVSSSDIIQSGYLIKKGQRKDEGSKSSKVTSSKRRYFLLTRSSLLYFTSDSAEQWKGTILLESSSVKACGECQIKLTTQKKDYYLETESIEARNSWIQSFQKAIGGVTRLRTVSETPMAAPILEEGRAEQITL